jgi:hypothetical protein
MLRTCHADLRAHGGFQWPETGYVAAPDWDPEPRCGGGLHGLLWGEGDGSLLDWSPTARWLVVEVDARRVVDLDLKVKAPAAWVLHVGDQVSATAYLAEHGGDGRAIVGRTATAGYRGTATAGDCGTATAGNYGTATAGYRGTATAGNYGTATAGYRGTATAGNYGTATAGDRGTATAGYRGTATAGDYGTATAGDGGVISIRWYDGTRYRLAVGVVGEGGIEPGVPYRVVDGRLQAVRA